MRMNHKELKTQITQKLKYFNAKENWSNEKTAIMRYGRWNIEEDWIQHFNKPQFERGREEYYYMTGKFPDIGYLPYHKLKLRNIKTTRNKCAHSGPQSVFCLYKDDLYYWCKMNNLKVKKNMSYKKLRLEILKIYD